MFRTWLFTCVALSMGCACSTNSSDVGGVNGNVHGGGTGGTGGSSGSAGTAGSAGSGAGGAAGASGGSGGDACDALGQEILDFANANRACSTTSDCTALSLACGKDPDHCSGDYAVNSGFDRERSASLRATSQNCAECGGCTAIPGPVECKGGRCEFANFNACAGPNSIPCGDTDFCDVDDGPQCDGGDCYGQCKARPTGCIPATCPGTCGRDGKVYCGECEANLAGVDIGPIDSCNLHGTGAGGLCGQHTDCQGGLKCCYPCGIAGCDNQCTAVDASGECPAFP